jgi:L-ascorbate metabolism protein UlaG (beta-lactamase superfamily)
MTRIGMSGFGVLAVLAAALGGGLLGACSPIPLPRQSNFHPSDADLGVTRVVHGSFVLELHETRLVVDPWFHAGLLTNQAEPLGLLPAALPASVAVLVTGDAVDHFDGAALRDLAATVPRAIAPPTLRERLLGLGFHEVTGLAWWEHSDVDGVTVTAVPASEPRANGYVLVSHDARIYVAGPTGAFEGMVDIAVAFPHLDVAILPIGGRRVFGSLHEMTPEQAAAAAATLGATRVVPSDYGAQSRAPWVWYAGDPLERFRHAMTEHGLADHVLVLETGESWHFSKPAPAS